MYDIQFWLMINLGWQVDFIVYVFFFEKKLVLVENKNLYLVGGVIVIMFIYQMYNLIKFVLVFFYYLYM